MWPTDLSPGKGTERPMCPCLSEVAAWVSDSLSTLGYRIGFLSKFSQLPKNQVINIACLFFFCYFLWVSSAERQLHHEQMC